MIFSLILWSPFKDNFDDPIEDLRNAGLRITRKNIFCFTDLNFENAVKKIYEPDSIADWKIVKKLDELNKREKIVCYLEIEIPVPNYRVKSDGRHISIVTEDIKRFIRQKYSHLKPFEGKPDVLIHMGDTHEHTNFVFSNLRKFAKKEVRLSTLFEKTKNIDYALTKINTPFQQKNFPKEYTEGKDIDILVSSKDSFELFEIINKFSDEHAGVFKVKKIFEKEGFRIRFLNEDNSLHYQLDVKSSKLVDTKNIVISANNYKQLNSSCEIVSRLEALSKKPHKTHHVDFIKQESIKNNIDMKILKEYGKINQYKELTNE
jgi:predicted nucleotidyltransferase